MSVSGSFTAPSNRAVSRLRISTAPSESSPASTSGASAETLDTSSVATSCIAADTFTIATASSPAVQTLDGTLSCAALEVTLNAESRVSNPSAGCCAGSVRVADGRSAHHHASAKLADRNLSTHMQTE